MTNAVTQIRYSKKIKNSDLIQSFFKLLTNNSTWETCLANSISIIDILYDDSFLRDWEEIKVVNPLELLVEIFIILANKY